MSEFKIGQALPAIVWEKSYEVGHPILDAQHRHIVDLINALHNAAEGEGLATAAVVLPHLVRFLENHFETEEGILREVGYPDAEGHAAEHRALMNRVTNAVATAKGGHATDLVIFAATIWSLVHEHTVISDQEFAPLLKSLSRADASAPAE